MIDTVATTSTEAMINSLGRVDLGELTDRAALLTRVDRKYLLPTADLPVLLAAVADGVRVLEMGGLRQFGYQSAYFDTATLDCYLDAARRRRRRFKIRIRTYLDTGARFLEVKTRGARESTVKQRTGYDGDGDQLGGDGQRFVRGALAGTGSRPDLAAYQPALLTSYRRTTLYVPRTASRVTIDTDVTWTAPGGDTLTLPHVAFVETKSRPAAREFDRLLWSLHHRPCSVSKYGTGLAALRPELPSHRWRPALRRHFPTAPDWNQP